MLKNYFKIAFRNLIKFKIYSFVNIAGLAIGMACCILILLWSLSEFTVDRFHELGDRLYVVGGNAHFGERIVTGPGTPPALGPALEIEYPEIVKTARFTQAGSLVLSANNKSIRENCHATDQNFFEMFSFPLLRGDKTTALVKPNAIVLTEETAKKFFGDDDPLGKNINIEGRYNFTVTGVLKSLPSNTTFRFNVLLPFESLPMLWNDPGYLDQFDNWSVSTYVLLDQDASYEAVGKKIVDRVNRAGNYSLDLFLSPYKDFYLYGMGYSPGRIGNVIFFSIIALFILVIACINFMNLATARAVNRAREIGLRKVSGASKKHIIIQFYGESFLLVLLSFVLAIMLLELFLPEFNRFVGKELTLDFLHNQYLAFGLIGVIFMTGFMAGSYPALYMSSFQPVRILKGVFSCGIAAVAFRKFLVVFQFVLSIVLIIFTIIILKQVDYMREADIGFDKERLVYFALDGSLPDRYDIVREELLQNPGIRYVSLTSRVPGFVYTNGSGWNWAEKDPNIDPLVTFFYTDPDFIETFGCSMDRGEFYRKDQAATASYATGEIVVNEAFAGIIGDKDIIGKSIYRQDGTGFKIIGVMKDFHFKPLYQGIEPMIIFLKSLSSNYPVNYSYLFARLGPGNIDETVDYIGSIYKKFNPDYPLRLQFYDDVYNSMYRGQQYMGQIIKFFAGLTILISCLGLMGLAAYSAEQRTREIGVRKVMGASAVAIVRMFSVDFLKLVVIANAIALPLCYLLASLWLSAFAYHTTVGLVPIAQACFITLTVSFVAVSYYALKAAWANPVESLRHE